MLAAALIGSAPEPVSITEQAPVAICAEDRRRIEYPGLGAQSPRIAMVYECVTGAVPRSAIYVLRAGAWQNVHAGDFVRGSLLSARGGKGARYRLVDAREGFADLWLADRALMLTRNGVTTRLWPIPVGDKV